jgi:hypothetical protein
MKLKNLLGWSSALCLSAMPLQAQTAQEVELLRKQLKELQDNFAKQQELQRQQIEALRQKVESLERSKPTAPATTAAPPAGAPAAGVGAKPWSPSDPIRLGSGRAYADVAFDALFAVGGSTARDIEGGTQLGAHDPNQRGFTVQNLELTLSGAVDPYFRGQAAIIYQINSAGESIFEVEEAFAESQALPGGLQLRAGQFFTEFGRHNPTHPHAWSFVDQPLVNGRMFGGDGMRNPGARLSWLVPAPFYLEAFLTVQDSHGETANSFRSDHEGEAFLGRVNTVGRVRSPGDLLFTPRLATSFELGDTQTLLLGASAALGPNASGPDTDTRIFGFDVTWKWRPVNHHGGFPFVSWTTEAMWRRYDAAAFDWDLNGDGVFTPGTDERDGNGDGIADVYPREALKDHGLYSQLAWGFRKNWVAAFRSDWVSSRRAVYERVFLGPDAQRDTRWRLSPNLTWFPSEFSKVRLQYNYDDRKNIGVDHSLWLQFEFSLGAHPAHKF